MKGPMGSEVGDTHLKPSGRIYPRCPTMVRLPSLPNTFAVSFPGDVGRPSIRVTLSWPFSGYEMRGDRLTN